MATDEIIILKNGKTITGEELVLLVAAELIKQGYVITKPELPSTEPAKPVDPVALPDVDILTPDEIALLGEQVGEHYGNPIYRGLDQNVRYLVVDGKLWPKPTPTNLQTNEKGDWAVPASFKLKAEWGWFRAKDGAYAAVPFPTKEPGPDWLVSQPPAEQEKITLPITPAILTHYELSDGQK